jgi:hypothetical protein
MPVSDPFWSSVRCRFDLLIDLTLANGVDGLTDCLDGMTAH